MTGTVFKGPVQRQDMALYDGVSLNASRVDPNGGIVSGLRVGDAVDVLAVYGNGVNQRGAAISNAINAIAGDRALLLSPGRWVIDDNITIPARHTLWVMAGAVLDVSSGRTVTIQGTVYRFHTTWTTGSGTVTVQGRDVLDASQFDVASVKTATYTVVAADHRSLIPVNGAFTVNLPAVSSVWNGFEVAIKNVATTSVAVVVDGNAAETIDTFATIDVLGTGTVLHIVSDGTNWRILSRITVFSSQANTSTTPFTVDNTDKDTLVNISASDGNKTVNLTAAATLGNGFRVVVKKVDSTANTVTIDPSGAETIDGVTTEILRTENEAIDLLCDGTNWRVISRTQGVAVQPAKVADYTVLESDENTVILVDASGADRTVNLPAVANIGSGFRLDIKKTDTSVNEVIIDGNASETIDGQTRLTLKSQNEVKSIISDGSNWRLLSAIVPGYYTVIGANCRNNSTTPNTQHDQIADVIVLGSTLLPSVVIRGPASITNNISTAGPAANGRDQSGSFAASNWIHFYWIWNGDTLATISSLVAPPTGPTLPSGFTHWAYATAILFNATPRLIKTHTYGSFAQKYEDSTDASIRALSAGVATVFTDVDLTSFLPPNSRAAFINFQISVDHNAEQAFALNIRPNGSAISDYPLISTRATGGSFSTDAVNTCEIVVPDDRIIEYAISNAPSTSGGVFIDVLGYRVPNGG